MGRAVPLRDPARGRRASRWRGLLWALSLGVGVSGCGSGGEEAIPRSPDVGGADAATEDPAPSLEGDSLLLVANLNEAPLHFLPQDWADLFHFRFADELLMPSPESSPEVRAFMAAVIEAEARRVGSVDAGFDWLRRLDTTVLAYEDEPDDLRWRLRQGHAWFALLPASEAGPLLEREGFRVVALRSGSDPLRWVPAPGDDPDGVDETPDVPGDWLARWASQVRGRG